MNNNNLQFYKHHLVNQSHWFTIDPGCRSNGGTGLAFWSYTQTLPVETKQFGSMNIAGLHDIKMEHVLNKITKYLRPYSHEDYPVFIEEPQFFQSLKGQTAAKSGALHKLTFFYGRLFQLVKHLGLKPIPVTIAHWKGQMDKARTKKKIDRLYPDNNWKGDELDAVGIGLFLKGKF